MRGPSPGRGRKPVEELGNGLYEPQADRRRRLMANGMCISCGHEKSIPGVRGGRPTYCPACYETQRRVANKSDRRGRLGITKKQFVPADLPEIEPEPEPAYEPGSLRDRLARRRRQEHDDE